MVAVVKQTLGNIHRGDACALIREAVEDHFMFAETADGQQVVIAQAFLNIISIECGKWADHLHVLATEREDVGVGFQHYSEVAEESADTSESSIIFHFHAERLLVLVEGYTRGGQELLEALADTDGTAAGTATTMRRGESLVEVDVHDIEAHVARTAFAEKGVEVSAVVVHQATSLVHHFGDFQYARLEDTEGVGVGHHHGCHLVTHLCEELAEVVNIHSAVRLALDLYNLQATDSGRGGVGAVGGVGDKDFGALLAVGFMTSADDHETRKLTVCTGAGVQSELAEASQLRKRLLEVEIDFQGSLTALGGLQGVQTSEGLHGGYFLVDDGVVLHRAGTERIEPVVDTEVVVTEVRVVTNNGQLVALRQTGSLLAAQCLGQFSGGMCTVVVLRQRVASATFL